MAKKQFRKGDLVKVDHKPVRGFVIRFLGGGFIDIFCEDENRDYTAREDDCQIHTWDINIFDMLREKGILAENDTQPAKT